MNINTRSIVDAIKANNKRMAKIASERGFDKRRKAEAIVIAECAAQKLKLSRGEIVEAIVALTSA